MPERDTDFPEVLICEMAENGNVNLVLGKALSVLPETEPFEPVRNLLHRIQRYAFWTSMSASLATRPRLMRPHSSARRHSRSSSTIDHRALVILHRPKRLVGRNAVTQLIIVAWVLGFFGLLHLKQIGGMHLATVGTHIAFAE
jgi:hypothetical protein